MHFCREVKGGPFLASLFSNITKTEGKNKSAFSVSQGTPCDFNFPCLPAQMLSEMMLVDER